MKLIARYTLALAAIACSHMISSTVAKSATDQDLSSSVQSGKVLQIKGRVCGGQIVLEKADDEKVSVITSYDLPGDRSIQASLLNNVLDIHFSGDCNINSCRYWSNTKVKVPVGIQGVIGTSGSMLQINGELIADGKTEITSSSGAQIVIKDISSDVTGLDAEVRSAGSAYITFSESVQNSTLSSFGATVESAGGLYIQGLGKIGKGVIEATSTGKVQAEMGSFEDLKATVMSTGSIQLSSKAGTQSGSFNGQASSASTVTMCSLQFSNIDALASEAGTIEVGAADGAKITGKAQSAGSITIYGDSPDIQDIQSNSGGSVSTGNSCPPSLPMSPLPTELTEDQLKNRDGSCLFEDNGGSFSFDGNGGSNKGGSNNAAASLSKCNSCLVLLVTMGFALFLH